MASMNVSLPDPLRDWVQQRIESGRYASVSDYMRDLIRRDQDTERQLSVADIRRSIEDGRARGAPAPAGEVFGRIEKQLKDMAG